MAKTHKCIFYIFQTYSIVKDQNLVKTSNKVKQIFMSKKKLEDLYNSIKLIMVEVNGFEPMTSCVQGRRSPS